MLQSLVYKCVLSPEHLSESHLLNKDGGESNSKISELGNSCSVSGITPDIFMADRKIYYNKIRFWNFIRFFT